MREDSRGNVRNSIGTENIWQRDHGSVEITYFGLGIDVHGHGLGGWFLTEALHHGFSFEGVERVWLHTCSLDGPHARTNYEARGMRVFDTEVEWKMLR